MIDWLLIAFVLFMYPTIFLVAFKWITRNISTFIVALDYEIEDDEDETDRKR